MLFAIIETSNIRVKWKGWQKEWIRQVMIWQLQMQHTLGMLHFGELFTAVCNAKHTHYFMGGDDKIGVSS